MVGRPGLPRFCERLSSQGIKSETREVTASRASLPTNNQQPTTNNQQPTTNNQQPTTNNKLSYMRNDIIVKSVQKYCTLGWNVYPVQSVENGACTCSRGSACTDAGKHPNFNLGGLRAATSSVQRAEKTFGESNASIGLQCGEQFWVLDVDGPQGLVDLERLVAEHGDLPGTPTAETGGGGRHYYFAADARVRCRTKIHGMSIDTKAKGGMVVAPPSSHVSGGEYRWLVEPESIALATAPDWLIEFVTSKQSSTAKSLIFTVEDNDLRTAPGVSEGERNSRLCQLVGAELARNGNKPDLLKAATDWGRQCDPPLPDREVQKVVGSLVALHLRDKSADPRCGDAKVREEHRSGLTVKSFDLIDPKPVDWLWLGRLALGKLTLLTGDGGVGKSMLTCYAAAIVSTGRNFCDGSKCEVGDVFLVGAEDGAEDTIRPRLDAAGANVTRVHLVGGPIPPGAQYATPVNLGSHIDLLDKLLTEYPGAKLLVIDPIMDYLGAGVNSDKSPEVRSVLRPLRALAERHQIAVILVNHLNRNGKGSKNRSLGSGAFVHVCRVELRVLEDPNDADRRLFLPVKNNLAAAPGLAYRIESADNGAGHTIWEDGPVDLQIGEVEADCGTEPRGAIDEAVEWISAMLADGPVKASEMEQQARRDGISESTLKRAKSRLKVKSYQENRGWWWRLAEAPQCDGRITDDPNNPPGVGDLTEPQSGETFPAPPLLSTALATPHALPGHGSVLSEMPTEPIPSGFLF